VAVAVAVAVVVVVVFPEGRKGTKTFLRVNPGFAVGNQGRRESHMALDLGLGRVLRLGFGGEVSAWNLAMNDGRWKASQGQGRL
jgi:hypothetical protein